MSAPVKVDTTARGSAAERIAGTWLRRRGLRRLDANYRCRTGEIDLVMRDGAMLVFVEVRYRRTSAFGSGADTVNSAKRRRLVKAASRYLQQHPQWANHECRFDVVSMSGDERHPEIDWIRHAFDA